MRTAHDLGPDDLVLSYFTMTGVEFEDRVAAAAAAGFAGIGLYLAEYGRMKAYGWTTSRMADVLDHHGMVLAELEALRAWPTTIEATRQEGQEALAHELADAFGVRYLQCIGSPPAGVGGGPAGVRTTADERHRQAAAFGALCDRAGDHGLVVGIEFLPFTDVVDAKQALEIVETAGRANGGVCVDSWHHERGARDLALISNLPGERILAVQLNDGTITPVDPALDYRSDCLAHRYPPGEGEFDLVALVRALDASGLSVPISLEVPSLALAHLGPGEICRRIADGMRSVLATARGPARRT